MLVGNVDANASYPVTDPDAIWFQFRIMLMLIFVSELYPCAAIVTWWKYVGNSQKTSHEPLAQFNQTWHKASIVKGFFFLSEIKDLPLKIKCR